MAGSLNKVILIGNVGRDPEVRNTSDGREIASLSLATSESWKDRVTGERKDRTEWHRVSVFSEGLVGVIKSYVKKGTKLYIEGQLQTRKWIDNSGQERYTTEVVLQNYGATMILLDSRTAEQDYGQFSGGTTKDSGAGLNNVKANLDNSELDDEIPF